MFTRTAGSAEGDGAGAGLAAPDDALVGATWTWGLAAFTCIWIVRS